MIGKNIRSLSPTFGGKFSMTAMAILEFLADESTVTGRIDFLGNRSRVEKRKVKIRNDVITAVPNAVTAKVIRGENFWRSPFSAAWLTFTQNITRRAPEVTNFSDECSRVTTFFMNPINLKSRPICKMYKDEFFVILKEYGINM